MSKDGGPAFPSHGSMGEVVQEGMTLRDYFAAAALPAVIASYMVGNGPCVGTDHAPSNCGIHAYRFADAMLKARES